MIISAIKCKLCGDTIYSRCRHDMRWCTCKKCAIDGGFDYMKITGNPSDIEMGIHVDVPNVSEKDLYDDWNNRTDKYGKIHDDKSDNR